MDIEKPCYLLYDRTEAQTCSTTRHAREWKIRVGATKDGIIKVIDMDSITAAWCTCNSLLHYYNGW